MLIDSLKKYNVSLEIIFVDDGSTDDTISNILKYSKEFNVTIIQLSRNFGKEAALFAGLENSRGDAVIPYDIDMQDPLIIIIQLVECWIGGALRVVAERRDRHSETFFKRHSSGAYYRIMRMLSDTPSESEIGDFQLLDKEVVKHFIKIRDKVRYNKGLFSWMGFDPVVVGYSRNQRTKGLSKFQLSKLFHLATNGIFSFSTKPIKVIAASGFFVALISFVLVFYFL